MIRAAFATGDGTNIDRHFGAAERFDIYEIDDKNGTCEKVDVRSTDRACQGHTHNVERIEQVISVIDDCNVVFAECIGGHAAEALEAHGIESIEMDRPILLVINRILHSRVRLVQDRYLEHPKERKQTESGRTIQRFRKLQKRHPCMGAGANVTAGRIHLPVSPGCNIQCRFCTRRMDKSEIKPGVSSLILKPEEAIETIRRAKKLCPSLSVVGIAGPGDTLATDQALETFRLVKKEFPELICCLSTNGFRLPDKVDQIAEIGIETVTVTVNAIDPEIEAKINEFVIDEKGVKHTGTEGAELLISHQMEGIRRAAELGIVVKINSVLVPGVNDQHIPEVARVTSELGASILNIIPLIPQNGMADIPAPSCQMLEEVRQKSGQYLEVFRHCQHCRADALGIPGRGRDLHTELYQNRTEQVVETFSHG